MKKAILACVIAGYTLTGCMTYDPYTGEQKVSDSTKGSAIGALAGAAIGAAAADGKNHVRGALLGAAIGGAVGGGVGYYMDKQEAELRHQLQGTGVQVQRNGNDINLIMPGNITFDLNQASIRSQFYDVLHSVALVLQKFDKTAIQVNGFTDSTGKASYNMRLSQERAQSVASYLVNQGIAAGRIQARGFGENAPIASNATAAGRQANRRVELKLVPLEQQING